MYTVTYKVKVDRETVKQKETGVSFDRLNDCAIYLHNSFEKEFGEIFESESSPIEDVWGKNIMFFWSIEGEENYNGAINLELKLNKENFLKVILGSIQEL